MWRRSYLLVLPIILLLLTVLITSAKRPVKPKIPKISVQSDPQNPLGLECKTDCTEAVPREPIAELTWRATEAELNQQSLEVTAYKNGFEKGLLVRLFPRTSQPPGIVSQPETSPQQPLPGLDRIAISQVNVSKDPDLVVVRVAGVQGGVNYFWRLRNADGSVSLSSVIQRKILACPTDLKPEADVIR
jgi:hypothetical protein